MTQMIGHALGETVEKISNRASKAKPSSSPPGDDGAQVREREQRWHRLSQQLGPRYADCRVKTFRLSGDKAVASRQMAVVDAVRAYGEQVEENIRQGRGVVLAGPPGTGQDHLLVGLMFAAVGAGLTVEWRNGMDLFGAVRDGIGNGTDEGELLKGLVRPDVLVLSDPVPPWGPLTQFQAAFLFRVIDRRYRDLKPVWLTTNTGGESGDGKMGAALVDRLRHGAMSLVCNWPSYRAS
jgi:DNA replication protein DnaC